MACHRSHVLELNQLEMFIPLRPIHFGPTWPVARVIDYLNKRSVASCLTPKFFEISMPSNFRWAISDRSRWTFRNSSNSALLR